MDTYTLEKWIWTEADFDIMGWHDASIYSMRMDGNLCFDIDYIFKWNKPEVEHFCFTFFVAPCTLCYKEVRDLSFELNQPVYDNRLEIAEIELEINDKKQKYTIVTQQGHITFEASGYIQTVRMYPSFQLGQTIEFDERGGFSFETTIDNKLPLDVQERVNDRKAKEYEHYILAKERHVLKDQIEALEQKRDANEIQLKDFIKEKNYLKDKLSYYNILLKGTRYWHD